MGKFYNATHNQIKYWFILPLINSCILIYTLIAMCEQGPTVIILWISDIIKNILLMLIILWRFLIDETIC